MQASSSRVGAGAASGATQPPALSRPRALRAPLGPGAHLAPRCWPSQLAHQDLPHAQRRRVAPHAQPQQRQAAPAQLQQQQHLAAARRQFYQPQRKRPPAVVYLPNFLHAEDAAVIKREYQQLKSRLRPELNTVAVGRLGCYLPKDSPSVAILSSREVAEALTQRLRSAAPLSASDFPMELRSYAESSHMPWHKDEQLYDVPQWECIYTVENSSDSVTQWRDDGGGLFEQATDDNSVLAVLAEAWDHRVTPVRRGQRAIIKWAMTSSHTQLPSFRANLDRQAYAS